MKVNGLKKIYNLSAKDIKKAGIKDGSRIKVAVDGISFSAEHGQIFGLLGTNGAGKTTTLRCIATLIEPTEGNIEVEGFDTKKQPDEVRKKIGFLTNDIKLDPQFTPKYLFEFFGKMHGMGEAEIAARKEKLFKFLEIESFENKKIFELSTGMKQKAAIACCLVHDPEVIIFDEPTTGLDIITARLVTDFLLELKKEGKLIIMSTHIMSEAEKLCDKIALIIDGKLMAEGTCKEICESQNKDNLEDAFFEIYKANHKEVM